MPVKVAINGFGRIGRLVLRAIVESGREDVVPVAINDLGSVQANAHLFAYDSVHGRFPGQIEVSGNTITIRHNGKVYGPLTVSAERDRSGHRTLRRNRKSDCEMFRETRSGAHSPPARSRARRTHLHTEVHLAEVISLRRDFRLCASGGFEGTSPQPAMSPGRSSAMAQRPAQAWAREEASDDWEQGRHQLAARKPEE